ncbi:MAG: hypothetical protein RJA81_119 [Planctomycetota bacterium]
MPETNRQLLNTLFLHPVWLWAAWLAIIPLLILRIYPKFQAVIPSGWIPEYSKFGNGNPWQFKLRYYLQALCIFLITIALASPQIPTIDRLGGWKSGHQWAVIIDCSGSMAQIDPGQTESRLKRLTQSLENTIRNRPYDQFTLIRVAGFADQLGVKSSNTQFLIQCLNEMKPALPGEDGTSLGDGLVLAAHSLQDSISRDSEKHKSASVLLISDGRDNPPDANAQNLEEVSDFIKSLEIPFDWLRIQSKSPVEETADSRDRALKSMRTLEKLVEQTHGSLLSTDIQNSWSNLTEKTLDYLELQRDQGNWTASSLIFLVISILVIICLFVLEISQRPIRWLLITIQCLKVIALIIAFRTAFLNLIQPSFEKDAEILAKRRVLLVVDVSPSMAAEDSLAGSRLNTAKLAARGMIERLSTDPETAVGVVIFSGRPLKIMPWTNDWSAVMQSINQLELRQVRPDGSNWQMLFELLLGEADSKENSLNSPDDPVEALILTDGEASVLPDSSTVAKLRDHGLKCHFLTFGNDSGQGTTFPNDQKTGQLWLDPATGQPARSRRFDETARQFADLTKGKCIAIGISDFDPFQLTFQLWPESHDLQLPQFPAADRSRTIASGVFITCIAVNLMELLLILRFRLITGMLLIITVSQAGCYGRVAVQTSDSYLQTAYRYSRLNEWIKAESCLKKAALHFPSDPLIKYHLGLMAIQNQHADHAISLFQQNLELLEQGQHRNQKTDRLLKMRSQSGMAYALAMSGQWKRSLQAYETVLASAILEDPKFKKERNALILNRNYVQLQDQKAPSPEAPKQSDSHTDGVSSKIQSANSNLTVQEELNERVQKVRNRSRVARKTFEKPGDEIVGPINQLRNKPTMNW